MASIIELKVTRDELTRKITRINKLLATYMYECGDVDLLRNLKETYYGKLFVVLKKLEELSKEEL